MKKWLAVTGAAALVFLLVWEEVQATRLGFELDETRRAVQDARNHNSYLQLELERRTAPAELARDARERLGMLPPSPDAVVALAEAGARPQTRPEPLLAAALAPAAAAAELAPASRPGGLGARLAPQLLSWLIPSPTDRVR